MIFNTTNGFGKIWDNNKKQQNVWNEIQHNKLDMQQHEIDGDSANGFGMINEHQNHNK